jgi:Nif-specific regulatory protein
MDKNNNLHELKRTVDELSFLNKLSNTISSTLDVQEIMATIITNSISEIGVEQGTIMLLEEKSELPLKTLIRGVDEKHHGNLYKLGEYLSGWMIDNHQPLLVNDTSTDQRVKGLEATKSGISSLLSVPLIFRGKLIGAVNLFNKKDQNQFTENDQKLMSIIASQVASFLVNARSFEQVKESKDILQKQTINLQKEIGYRYGFEGFIGESSGIKEIQDKIQTFAGSGANVLINGETGTGKELVAKMIHYNGDRKEKTFVDVNSAAIPENLVESEFFGIEEGAATGVKKRIGLFEQANGGTIFIDEIGDMSMASQAKILRVLQEKKVRRVGSNHNIDIDVRVIAATNKILKEEIKQKLFREDLYYRLCVLEIQLPPLRERTEDIPLLIDHFVDKYSGEAGKVVNRFSDDALNALINYDWPGNIRELANVVERSVIMTNEPEIGIEHLTPEIKPVNGSIYNAGDSFEEALTNLKKHLLTKALRESGNNKAEAARNLKISKGYLFRLLNQLELK